VANPLVVWEDLYEYFDAYDLWMESPGVLFQVMAHIARINLARDKEIAFYATEWVNANTAKLTTLPQGHDVMNSVFSKEDERFFDVAALTPYEKVLLARTLNQRVESLKPTVESLQASQQDRQRQGDGRVYRSKKYPHHHLMLGMCQNLITWCGSFSLIFDILTFH
jgi:hypothetical protein